MVEQGQDYHKYIHTYVNYEIYNSHLSIPVMELFWADNVKASSLGSRDIWLDVGYALWQASASRKFIFVHFPPWIQQLKDCTYFRSCTDFASYFLDSMGCLQLKQSKGIPDFYFPQGNIQKHIKYPFDSSPLQNSQNSFLD